MVATTSAVVLAAAGRLPGWAVVGCERRGHIARVAALMESWAAALGLEEAEVARWRAAAWLHDAVRDAPATQLRSLLPEDLARLPDPLLHGHAAAARLRQEGVTDAPLLAAVAWHTTGHPDLDMLGCAMYAADYLEPGRGFDVANRAALRARMPEAMGDVVAAVVAARIAHLVRSRVRLERETLEFHNAVVRL